MSYLSIQDLHVAFKDKTVLNGFSLEINQGSIYALIGPSGCGKSTLLKTLCGLTKSKQGSLLLKGEKINSQQHTLAYIPQNYGLLDWLTVEQNISVAEKLRKTSSTKKQFILEQLQIENWLQRYPKQLSGGQQQRVALARAWCLEPELLLMDEPFSSLDTFTAEKSRQLFLQLWKSQQLTTVLVTHNLQEACYLAKRIVLLSDQPAQVLKIIDNPLFDSGLEASANEYHLFEQRLRKELYQSWENVV